ncbi:FAD-dependent oxidoreductase [Micromonospora cathayae]|uniref:Methyltransferase domain-containing protein n=1 Tax=Micromonospora cathayae TaxID=3028804 RepID=A0ABY7ZLE3_9ACTN|nr:FAD-dependent oxidoreductase [Micromonospora sp. HUAS 3]WDZ83112.1 methyltransferase domain-containing protein [Micromonospora sp. HUAS 3]
MDDRYDVVVIGGGPAGLSGALTLARARRSVLVVDAGQPRNAPAGQVHGLLGQDGVAPAELLAAARGDVTRHGGQVTAGTVTTVTRDDGTGFLVTLADGRITRARRLLVATGGVDRLPDIAGLADRWGRDVLHCPYCHGFEVADRRIGVIADGPLAVPQALLWRQWSDQVLLLRHHGPAPDPGQAEQLAARAVPVVDGPVTGLTVDHDRLTGVRLADGTTVAVDALVVASRLTVRADPLAALGLVPSDAEHQGHVVGTLLPADPSGATAVPGVWVAGNASSVTAQVVTAAGQGVTAAAAINADLVAEDTDRAVDGYRRDLATMFEQDAWEERYRSRTAVWSGRPNPQLVVEAGDLTPGRALDVGCGEGADAVWLAGRGWQVTAVDLAPTAVQRARAHAAAAGVGDRVTVRHADLRVTPPEPGAYDLVSAHYVHLPAAAWRDLVARLADAVAPGGTLLIVGHHPWDLRTTARRMHFPDLMFTAEQAADLLDPNRWQVTVAQARPRATTDHDGRDVTVHDAVLTARRLA